MQPLTDPELIAKFQRDFPCVIVENLTCVYNDNDYICYKDIQTTIKYLFDKKIDLWIKEDTEYWRGISIS
jgi:hypothetical protein